MAAGVPTVRARRWVAFGVSGLLATSVLIVLTSSTAAQAGVSPGTTERVSVTGPTNDETQATAPSFDAAISGDGQQVAFDTRAALDPLDARNDDGADSDVYLRDRSAGRTVLISRGVAPVVESPSPEPTPPPEPSPPREPTPPPVPSPPPIFSFRMTAPNPVAPLAAVGQPADGPANGDSQNPSVSATGRYVAFDTTATNIPDGDNDDTSDVVICDRDPNNNGIFDEHINGNPALPLDYRYTVVSRTATNDGDRISAGYAPSLAGDASAVAWIEQPLAGSAPSHITITTLTKDAMGRIQPVTGASFTVVPAAVLPPQSDAGPPIVSDASQPALSADGRTVVFQQNYQSAPESGYGYGYGSGYVFATIDAFDRGASVAVRLDDAGGAPANNNVGVNDPTVAAGGRLVAFHRWDFAAPEGTPGDTVVLVNRDPDRNGKLGPADNEPVDRQIAAVDATGQPAAASQPALSADGRYLAFGTFSRGVHNGVDNPYRTGQCDQDSAPESSDPQSNDLKSNDLKSKDVTGMGSTTTGSPVPSPTSVCDIVVRDLVLDQQHRQAGLAPGPAELASPSQELTCAPLLPPDATCEANDASTFPVLSEDGRVVAYQSAASDLVANDTNEVTDVFAREFQPTVTGAPVDFGTVPLGDSVTQTATVRHVGFGPAYPTGVTLIGPNAGDFQIFPAETCTGLALHEGETCAVSIRFTPSATGQREAVLQIAVRGRTPVPIRVTGGVGPPVDGFRASPNPVPFGQRLVLTSSGPKPVTVSNAGRAPFTIISTTLPKAAKKFPGDYKITADTCTGVTLAVGATCRVTVVNTPGGTGSRPAVLQFVDTTVSGTHLVGLTGSGTTATIQVNPGVVPAGRVTTVTGQGFPASHSVLVEVLGLPGSSTVTTASNGTFSAALVIFLHSTVGNHVVRVTAPGTPVSVTAPLLVVTGTFQPPDFIGRR